MRVHLKNVVNFWENNKSDIIYKMNGFLFIISVMTLITMLNVRFDSENIEDSVDEKQKMEQVDEKESVITNNGIVELEDVLYYDNSFEILKVDGDYEKIYPYYIHDLKNFNHDKVQNNNPITVRSDEELSNFVSFDTHSNLYTCILNRKNYNLNLSWNKVDLLKATKAVTTGFQKLVFLDLPPFIWIKARSPSHTYKVLRISFTNYLFSI